MTQDNIKIWIDGEMVDKMEAKVSVFDHAVLYGDGVFEGIRVYNGRIFECKLHMDRLYESAERIRLTIPYSREELVTAMEQCIENNKVETGYIRLVVTRGFGDLGLNPFNCPRATVFCIADNIALYPQDLYEKGLRVIKSSFRRCSPDMLDPRVKSLNYLNNIRAKIEAIDEGCLEAVMLNEAGNVAECTGDNIFILKNGKMYTPNIESGILVGVTRAVVIMLAKRMGLEVIETELKFEDLQNADEMFLTGSAAEVIAVTQVDDVTIGDGKAGETTMKLLKAFRDYIDSGEELQSFDV